jgi:GDP-L-fucose synthase
VGKLLFLGSSCIYPRVAPQPMGEDALLTGPLEPTNEPYAVAKIAGIKMCESYNRQYGTDFRSVMPCNLYGPGDNYHPENSHVIPALIRRIHKAKLTGAASVTIRGTGTPKREFLYVDDMASSCLELMELDKAFFDAHTKAMLSQINIGTGEEVSISQLAQLICQCIGYTGNLDFAPSMPDGTPRKILDISRLRSLYSNWSPVPLEKGLTLTIEDFLQQSL